MADTQMKQEALETANGKTTQNRGLIVTRAGAKRRKFTSQTRKMTNRNTNGHTLPARRYPSIEELLSSADSSNSLDYQGFAGDHSPASRNFVSSRGGETLAQRESNAMVQLRAELEQYKQENRELRARLAELLNLRELEKTLRMTLQSFGVPTPKSPREACPCSHSYESPWQTEPEFQQIYSSSEEEEEEVTEFQRAIPSQSLATKPRLYQTAVQPQPQPQLQPQPQSQHPNPNPSTLYQANSGRARQDFQRFPRNTAACPATQVELVPSSGIYVDSNRLSSIAFKKGWSYTLLTRSLMPMVFNTQEMESSCVRGERATGKGSLNSPARPALDQAKVQAIITFVSGQFPDIQPYQITQTMNQKLVDVRGTIKKRTQAAKFVK
ncbi:uncharacterized protein LOC119730488 [Patiria miniata]|uniref:BEN domain-containing protein n=1 Tax=Patiria miniata TaxID=46514 RepID=A0A914A7D6_PATMI|nr:uncharacterized protein LOC119730488 [Patiria miniata]XP_038059365.1 uncharacterized protein LOC119730488 [Patiria miniata]XP_038059366.1 uncharacterized protein LOC119730488 [Patiria miniata]